MAESTLTLGYLDFCHEASFEYGSGVDFTALTGYVAAEPHTGEALAIDRLVQEAYRQVLNPPPLVTDIGSPNHEWRFLKPIMQLQAWPAQAEVTGRTLSWVSSDVGSQTTVIATATGTFYSNMVGRTIVETDGTEFLITDFVDSTKVRINTYYVNGAAWTSAFATDPTWTMAAGDYRLPDDFGGHEHPLSNSDPSQHRHPIPWTGELEIRQQRDYVIDRTGYPRFAAARPIHSVNNVTIDGTPADSTNLTNLYRFDAMLWPIPDTLHTLVGRYLKLVNKLTVANPYPVIATMMFSELMMASVRATVEKKRHKVKGTEYGHFMEALTAAVSADQRAIAPEYFGQSGGGTDNYYGYDRHGHDNLVVTVNGATP